MFVDFQHKLFHTSVLPTEIGQVFPTEHPALIAVGYDCCPIESSKDFYRAPVQRNLEWSADILLNDCIKEKVRCGNGY